MQNKGAEWVCDERGKVCKEEPEREEGLWPSHFTPRQQRLKPEDSELMLQLGLSRQAANSQQVPTKHQQGAF